ncbi:hypothetical protein KPH14_004663 [Odynerus spinipes]|uniref:Uncharacterized protein n=1 Tax=Odynerus spinipes TaxID=1348599 RepID=A0AAD9RMD8_9HYME|nr:hypothetical protein KPH14_004663 [Odynerus spinipes]
MAEPRAANDIAEEDAQTHYERYKRRREEGGMLHPSSMFIRVHGRKRSQVTGQITVRFETQDDNVDDAC